MPFALGSRPTPLLTSETCHKHQNEMVDETFGLVVAGLEWGDESK
jgi:hypothetical protein